ncbi:MAG: hypothetical protein JWR80_1783 [Bradyrhizobium sp.]|nr:hypothetical protein [Bradyrhizobium sp.]
MTAIASVYMHTPAIEDKSVTEPRNASVEIVGAGHEMWFGNERLVAAALAA